MLIANKHLFKVFFERRRPRYLRAISKSANRRVFNTAPAMLYTRYTLYIITKHIIANVLLQLL